MYLEEGKQRISDTTFLIRQMTKEDFNLTSSAFGGIDRIGSHFDHFFNNYNAVIEATKSGVLAYEKQPRNLEVRTNPEAAATYAKKILAGLEELGNNPKYDEFKYISQSGISPHKTFLDRELEYAITHGVHHNSMVRMILAQHDALDRFMLPEGFGIATPTQKYQASRN